MYPNATDQTAATPILLAQGAVEKANVSLYPVRALHANIHTIPEQNRASTVSLYQTIFGSRIPVPITSRRQDGPGELEIAGVPPGRYTVTLDSWGQPNATSEIREIDLAVNGEVSKRETRPLAILTVTLKEPRPREGVLRLRETKTGDTIEQAMAGPRGSQIEKLIPPGEYEISFRTTSDFFMRDVSIDGVRLAGRKLTIAEDSRVALALSFGQGRSRIDGVAVRAEKPAGGAMLVLVPEAKQNQPTAFRYEQSDTDGTFCFTNVAAGRYRILAIENGWALGINATTIAPYWDKGTLLQVGQDNISVGSVSVQ
jgi:hypothetical protein